MPYFRKAWFGSGFPKGADCAWNHLFRHPPIQQYMQTAALLPLSIPQSNQNDSQLQLQMYCNAPAGCKNGNTERKSQNCVTCSPTQCSAPNSHYSACPQITARKKREALCCHRLSFQTCFSSCRCGTDSFLFHMGCCLLSLTTPSVKMRPITSVLIDFCFCITVQNLI